MKKYIFIACAAYLIWYLIISFFSYPLRGSVMMLDGFFANKWLAFLAIFAASFNAASRYAKDQQCEVTQRETRKFALFTVLCLLALSLVASYGLRLMLPDVFQDFMQEFNNLRLVQRRCHCSLV